MVKPRPQLDWSQRLEVTFPVGEGISFWLKASSGLNLLRTYKTGPGPGENGRDSNFISTHTPLNSEAEEAAYMMWAQGQQASSALLLDKLLSLRLPKRSFHSLWYFCLLWRRKTVLPSSNPNNLEQKSPSNFWFV